VTTGLSKHFIIYGAVLLLGIACPADSIFPPSTDTDGIDSVLFWLPAGTETVSVANGPFWMSNFQLSDEQQRVLSKENLAKHFQSLTLSLFNLKESLVERHFERQKVTLAVEGSRHFRSPQGLGVLPYEGCAIAVFADDQSDRITALLADISKIALRIEEINGEKVAVFQERMEEDLWTVFVAAPRKNVVVVATDHDYLRETLLRIKSHVAVRALPDSLPEWKYVDKRSQFWGLRHFDHSQSAKADPTSPFGGRKSANIPDELAIGLSCGFDPGKNRSATITYLSSSPTLVSEIKQQLFPTEAERGIKGLNIRYQELSTGVVQGSFDLSSADSVFIFMFVLMCRLGHAIYL
jgi:hypothetical protein